MPCPGPLSSAPTVLSSCAAQEGRALGLDDLLPGGLRRVRCIPRDLAGAQWWGDCLVLSGDEPFFQKDAAVSAESAAAFPENRSRFSDGGEALLALDAASGRRERLFSFRELNDFLTSQGLNRVYSLGRLSFPLPGERIVQVQLPGQGYARIDFGRWALVRKIMLPRGASCIDPGPGLQAVAYTVGGNLFLSTAAGSRAVTREPEGVVCGQKANREEWGTAKGTFWSPDGQRLAFYRIDERRVEPSALIGAEAPWAETGTVRYPMAGTENPLVSVGIYDLGTQTVRYLQTADPSDRYFTNISWNPDSQKLYLIELNRDQNRAELCRYDALSGQREAVLWAEENARYVQPLHPVAFVPWMEGAYLCLSQRDGFSHFYLGRAAGGPLQQLTRGAWVDGGLLGFDEEARELVFTGNEASPLQNHVYRLRLEERDGRVVAGSPRRCCPYGGGWQEGCLSPSGRFLLSTWQSPDKPREVDLLDCRPPGRSLHLLSAPDPCSGCRMPSVEVGTLPAADGRTPLFYRLLKPADFDAARRYPAIVYVYGGPGIRLISDRWQHEARGWDLFMANRGYLLFTLDGRGSSGRGFEFESCTFRRLGVEEGRDQMCGVEFLKSLPYVDAGRIGVHGWSYGGHMAASLMLRHPGVFRAGVAGGAVTDWRYYETMYGERYMDSPQQNPEGYAGCDLKPLAGRLQGRLLLIHGGQDSVVLPRHALSFLQAAVEAGAQPDFFLYPGHGHNILGHDRVHLYEKITSYFDEHLK